MYCLNGVKFFPSTVSPSRKTFVALLPLYIKEAEQANCGLKDTLKIIYKFDVVWPLEMRVTIFFLVLVCVLLCAFVRRVSSPSVSKTLLCISQTA